MENVVKYFNSIEASFKKTKVITLCVVCMCVLISLGSVVYSFSFLSEHSDNIFILDRGTAYSATKAGLETMEKQYEIEDHVRRFHDYFFNIFPSREIVKRNIEAALSMSDQTVYDYYLDQQEKNYYSRMIENNVSQYITVDSVKVNMNSYPYLERTYGTVKILRSSNITAYRFESTGQVIDVGRSKSNPHGLMLEKFAVVRYDKIETRQRR